MRIKFLIFAILCFSQISSAGPSCESLFLKTFSEQGEALSSFRDYMEEYPDKAISDAEAHKILSALDEKIEAERRNVFKEVKVVIAGGRQKITFKRVDAKLSDKAFHKVIKRVLKLYETIDDIVDPNYLPSEVTIEVVANYDNAYHLVDIIHIPNQINFNGFTKHPRKSRAVIVHESGHDVVDKYLEYVLKSHPVASHLFNYFKVIEEGYVTTKRSQRLTEFYYEKIESYEKRDTADLTVDEILLGLYAWSKIEGLRESVELEGERLEKKSEYLEEKISQELGGEFTGSTAVSGFRAMTAPTHEFLADVLTVLAIRDKSGDYKPDAVHKSLHHTGDIDYQTRQDIEIYNRFRDFSKKMKLKGWEHSEVHVLFNPARSYVWEHYISRSKYRRHPDYLFARIAQGAINELLNRIENQMKDIDAMVRDTPEAVNARLIKYIDEEFTKKPL